MSTNTIKVTGSTGEVYISPQTTQTYKNVTLFGYGYLDWGRVVNQSLVTLMDKVDVLSTSGMSQITFDLETYTETQTVARTAEFNLWKTEYKTILTDMVNVFTTSVNENITSFTDAQTTINTAVTDELGRLDIKISDEYNTFISTVDEKITDVVNTNLVSIVSTINTAINATEMALSQLNSTKLSLDQKVLEFNNLIANFKITFQDAFDDFKTDTANTLEDNKNIIIQYVNEKLLGYASILTAQSDRLDMLEIVLEGVNLEALQNMIVDKVNNITSIIVNNYLSDLVSRVEAMEDYFADMDGLITTKVGNIVNPIVNTINDTVDVLYNKFVSYDATLTNFNLVITDFRIWTRDFDAIIETYFADKQEFVEEIKYMHQAYMVTAGNNTSLVSIMKKIAEATIKQTDYNSKNLINLIEQTQNSFISALRNSNFDENSLIKTETYKSNIQTNGLTNYKFDNIFKSSEFELLEFGYTESNDTSKIKFIFLSVKLPDSALPNDFDMTNLKVSLGSSVFQAPIFRLPRVYLIIDDINTHIPNYNNIIESQTIGTITDSLYYADIQSTDIIMITIPDSINFTSDMLITLTNNTNVISFKIDDLENRSSSNFVSKVVKNISSYSTAAQALINSTVLPYVTYSKTQTDINIPVKDLVKTISGKEFHIKVNLPTNGTLTNIIYNDGTSDITKTITNRDTFNPNLTTYVSNGWNSTLNFYKDILTTGVLKFTVSSTATKVTGTINYKIGTTAYSEDFSSEVSNVTSKQIEVTIASGGYTEIDTQPIFGTIDARIITADVKILDEIPTSDTYQMWIDAKNLSTNVIRSTRYLRVYNEYSTSLKFHINLISR